MKRKAVLFCIIVMLSVILVLAGCTKQGINTGGTEASAVRSDADSTELPSFSEEQSRNFGSLIGQFVLRCFQGQEELQLPDDLRTLCVSNDEMDYVLQRQQYLIDAILVMGGGQIRNLSLTDVELKEIEILSDEQVRVKAYVKLSFFYKDDAAQTPTGAGLEVTADLRKAANEQYLVENYEELSSDYASMKEDYRRFCEEERKHGASDARELTERYFAQRLEQLSAAVNDK